MTAEDKAKLLRSLAIDRTVPTVSPSAGRSRRRALALVLAATTILVAAGAVYAWFKFDNPSQPTSTVAQSSPSSAPPASPQPPAKAAGDREAGDLSASGYVVARRKATVAAEVTGKVVEVFVDEGVSVTAGQVVARLDSILAEKDFELARSRADAAEANVGAIAADLDDAKRILSRTQALSQRNFATEADLTKAQARVGVLAAQLKQAEAQLVTAQLDAKRSAELLEKYQIRAPFSGVVIDRSAQPGEMISPLSVGGFTRTGICTIVDMDSIEVEVDVNEAFIGRVKPGGAVNAVLDAYPDWTIPASVIAIVPTANRDKATVKVRIRLEDKDPRILPDMAVKVTFLRSQNAATAPQSDAAN